MVIVDETVPYTPRAAASAGVVAGPAPRLASVAFGYDVSVAQRAIFLAAGIAVAVLNWRLAAMPLYV
jgi:hypothetical protein